MNDNKEITELIISIFFSFLADLIPFYNFFAVLFQMYYVIYLFFVILFIVLFEAIKTIK